MTTVSRHSGILFIMCLVVILDNRSTLKLAEDLGSTLKLAEDHGDVARVDIDLSVKSNKAKEVWNPRGWNPKKNKIDYNCPRFATMLHIVGTGLGHKFAEVVFGMILAEETNSTFVFNDRIWSDDGKHGSYSWLLDFLPLDQSEVTVSELEIFSNYTNIVTVADGWGTVVKQSMNATLSCNVLFTTYLNWCCLHQEHCWCTRSVPHVGVYERVKWRIREAFSRSSYLPSYKLCDLLPLVSDEPFISISWHLRQGDIVLNANEQHFDRLTSQIALVLKELRHIRFHFFFLGEGNITKDFPFLPGLCKRYFEANCSLLNFDVRDTLFHMVDSDVLITSGSSFAAFAALLRTDGIILYEYPKEKLVGLYEVAGQGLIHPNGTIVTPSLHELEFQLQYTYNQKVKKMSMQRAHTRQYPHWL